MGLPRKAMKAMFPRGKWKLLRGDQVMVIAGKDKGQTGTITKVVRDDKFPRVIVEGLNLHKRHIKRTQDSPGGIITVEAPLHYSNVMLVDPVTKSPVRVGYKWLEDGTKVRVTRGKLASGSIVSKSDILLQRRKPRPLPGDKDTPLSDVIKPTYTAEDMPSFLLPQGSAGDGLPAMARSYSTMAYSLRSPWAAQPMLSPLRPGGAWGVWRGFAASTLRLLRL